MLALLIYVGHPEIQATTAPALHTTKGRRYYHTAITRIEIRDRVNLDSVMSRQHKDGGADNEDRLRSIHDELSSKPQQQQEQQSSAKSSPTWLPLESNPEVFTSFARRIGSLPEEWQFIDVVGFDDDVIKYIPHPVAAIILLFPCTEKIYAFRAQEKRKLLEDIEKDRVSPAVKKAFHLEQVASFGNACGTIAAVHSLTNAGLASQPGDNGSLLALKISGPVASFRDATSNLATAKERGKVLVSSDMLHSLSDEAASNTNSQTACPESGDTRLGHHYCAFVPVEVEDASSDDSKKRIHLVELDGTKVSPVDHGPIIDAEKDVLQATAEVIRERWMRLEPDRIDFSLMVLCKTS